MKRKLCVWIIVSCVRIYAVAKKIKIPPWHYRVILFTPLQRRAETV